MGCDDNGWEYRQEQVGPNHFRNVPIKPKGPINPQASEIYWLVCPETYRGHQIVGDVVICHDRDFK